MPLGDYKRLSKAKVNEVFERPVFVKGLEETKKEGGNTHVRLTLLDGEGEYTAMCFSTTAEQLAQQGVRPNMIAAAEIKVSSYNGKSFNINRISPYEGSDLSVKDFIVSSPLDAEEMFEEIISALNASADDMGGKVKPLAELTIMILERYKSEYLRWSAAVAVHHNFKGGLIYHSYRIFKSAEAICAVYPELDKELLLSAAAIHDIGKLWEYRTDDYGASEVTGSGVLFGHIYMGAKLVSNFADKYYAEHNDSPRFLDEKVRLLTHLILSHHGTREWGAAAPPAIPEAFVLHHLDNLDARVNACGKEFQKLRPGEITGKAPFTFEGRLYKPFYSNQDTE